MGSAQYEDGMSEVTLLPGQKEIDAFAKLHSSAEKIHIGEHGEIIRFKSIMDKLFSIEDDLKLIKTHFKIVPIIGVDLLTTPRKD